MPFPADRRASGAGKSSLAPRGLIPRLTTPGVVASVDLCAPARMKPSEGQADRLRRWRRSAEGCLSSRKATMPTPAMLADNLKRGGPAAAQPIVRCARACAREEQRRRHSGRSCGLRLCF